MICLNQSKAYILRPGIALEFHPNFSINESGARFQPVGIGYEILSNHELKAEYDANRHSQALPYMNVVQKAGLSIEWSESCPLPARSSASVKDMYYWEEHRAKTEMTIDDAFEELIAVFEHVKSPGSGRLASKHRAALWNLWIQLEKGPAIHLREAVAQAILDVTDAVLLATCKGHRDSITV